MAARLTLLVMTLMSFAVLADEPARAAPKTEKPPEIIVVDDVGVGDHFPSHVPGAAPWRLPPPETPVPPQPQAQPAPPPPAPQPPQPPSPAPRDLEQEALERASSALLQGNCEPELPKLAEVVDRTERAENKARARILRARCFSHHAKPDRALAEYLAYLRDFPSGQWAAEAREAVETL